MAGQERQQTRIRSVARAAHLLMLMASLPEHERSASRMAAELGTSVPTVYHLLNTLVDAKLLARDERKQYRFGLAVGVLATAYGRQAVPPPELLAPLRKIIDDTGESAYLSGWRDGSLVVLAHLAGTHAVQVTKLPGFRGAANARASGKVLLAFTDPAERDRYVATHPLERLTPHTITDVDAFDQELCTVARQGYATEIEEFALGVACISVPIWSTGILIGAYTISAPVHRYQDNRERYLACLRQAARLPERDPSFRAAV